MEIRKTQIKKVCSFYVNDWHLTTMILPYIYKQVEQNYKIVPILQNSIQSNIKEILSKMNLKEEINHKILQVNFGKSQNIKYSKIREELEKTENSVIILINGDKAFIEMVNQNIEKTMKNILIHKDITIVNCYNVTEFTNVSEITSKHEFILNTSGMKKIEEVSKKEEKRTLKL